MEEKKLAKIRKSNMKLYPIYKMVGLDWIFYYGIKVLFLTQVKQITPADIVLASSIYSLCCIIFQIPTTLLLEKIGKKNGIVLGQALTAIAMVIIMICPNFLWIVIVQIISAFGFDIRGIAESNFLNCSLPETKKQGEIFSKIDGGGYSKFCYVGAISVLISGFLYSVNPYIPLALCLGFNILAMIIAMNFVDIEKIEKKDLLEPIEKETKDAKQLLNELKESFYFMFHSKRLKTLLTMNGIIWGLLVLTSTYQETILKELDIPSYYIGIILAAFQFLVGVFSTKSIDFHNRFHNKSLTVIGLLVTVGSLIAGLVLILPLPFDITLMFIIIAFIARAYAKGMYQVNKKRYMGNFADKQILPKIYSLNGIYCNLGRMIIGFLGSVLLRYSTTANASLILGVISTGFLAIFYFYMKRRLGLKPEEYTKQDICYEEVKQERK